MISAFNHRLLLIEQALSNNGAVLSQLQLLELDCKPGADASSQSDVEESDGHELDRLREWAVRLRAQLARTERRVVRLRTTIERHDAQLSDIKSQIIWSSGGCAVVRAHSTWDARTDRSGVQREMTANREPVEGKWPALMDLQIPHQKLSVTHATASGGSWSARNAIDSSGVTPQLSRSFTSLLPAKRRQQSSVRVWPKATSSQDSRSFDVVRENFQYSTNELKFNAFR